MKSFVVNDELWDGKMHLAVFILIELLLAMKFLKTISIASIGGIGLGGIAGFLQILGLPYFYDDPISEVTITIAVPYMLYWLCIWDAIIEY